MRQLKHKTLTRMGVNQTLCDPSFEALSTSFHRIEESLPHLYHHILTSLTNCHSFCQTLETTFYHIPAKNTDNDFFMQALQRVREQADALEQAVSLTVLAPLQGLMQRCSILRIQLQQRDNYVINYDLLKIEYTSSAPGDVLRSQKQEKMERAWQEYQAYTHDIVQEILQLEQDHIQVRQEAMDAMKLYVAKFFLASQKKLWSSLDVLPKQMDHSVEVVSDNEEGSLESMQLRDASPLRKSLSKQLFTNQPLQLKHSQSPDADPVQILNATSVVSTPMAKLPLSPKRFNQPSTPRQSWLLDFLWSKDELRPPPPPQVRSPILRHRKNRMTLAPQEWAAVEEVMWELDKQALPPSGDTSNDLSRVTLFGMLKEAQFFSICSHLDVVSLARLAQTCQSLRLLLLDRSELWHRVIRIGGVPSKIRCDFWTWFQFERRDGSFQSQKVYDALLIKAAQLVNNSTIEDQEDDEQTKQIIAWFNDIDVDVDRTCHKSLFAKDVAEEWDLIQIPENDVAAMVEQALQMTSPCSSEGVKEPTQEEIAAIHATMRRLLRAYVIFNPRVGYCQGMNFIVRLLMDSPPSHEASVFWTFVSLCNENASLFEPGFHTLHTLFTKLDVLIQQQMPELHVHLRTQGVHVSMFAARWFLTLFTSLETFGPTLVLRLLDLYHVDRHRVLCGIALVVLEELKELILDSEFETILAILQYPRHYMPEPDFVKRKELIQHALVVSITRSLLI